MWHVLILQAVGVEDVDAGSRLWQVLAVTITAVILCVVLHWVVLDVMIRVLSKRGLRLSISLAMGVIGLLMVHVLEITLFAAAMVGLYRFSPDSIGSLEGDVVASWSDLWYYSACVYTTVGFGDIVPRGPLRFMAGIEALTGLLLVTWSASFTFLVMQRAWQQRYQPPARGPGGP